MTFSRSVIRQEALLVHPLARRDALVFSHLDFCVRAIDQDGAFAMGRRRAREEGIFRGASTGLNVMAALALAQELGPGHRVVPLGCDSGLKYLGGTISTCCARWSSSWPHA